MKRDEPRSTAFNTCDQLRLAGGNGVYITDAVMGGRTPFWYGVYAMRMVDGKHVDTNPESRAWYDYKRKVFSPARHTDKSHAARRHEAVEAAKAWIKEQGWYDGPWAQNRLRDWLPAAIHKQFPLRSRKER